ncbi:MAG: hypothetical protein QHH09_02610 [Microgenomates group bacterium]|nr:hypothetical protein [Microgenomates group bacterium]
MADQNPNQPKIDVKNLKDQAALLSFVDDLIEARKDPNITDKNREQMRAFLLQQVNEAINTHLITLLSEDEQKELDVLLDKDVSNEELDRFFQQKIPNLTVEIATALLNFRAAYLFPVIQKDLEQQKNANQPSQQQNQSQSEETSLPPAPVPTATGVKVN